MTNKIGIMGTSWISGVFAYKITQNNNFELKSVLGTSKEKAENFILYFNEDCVHKSNDDPSQKISCPEHKSFEDIEDFFKSGIDTVYVGTPNSLHYPQAKMALEFGLNVIVEKPAVSKKEEWEELVKLAEEKDLLYIEAFRHIWDPNLRIVKDNISKMDKVQDVYFTHRQYSSKYNAYKKGDIQRVWLPEFNGGALFDLGVYDISGTIALFGLPEITNYIPKMLKSGVDAGGLLTFIYKDFEVRVDLSKITSSFNNCEIYDNSGNVLSFNTLGSIKYIMNNNKPLEVVNSAKTKMTLGSQKDEFKVSPWNENNLILESSNMQYEVDSFALLLEDKQRTDLLYTYKEAHEISFQTHKILQDLKPY